MIALGAAAVLGAAVAPGVVLGTAVAFGQAWAVALGRGRAMEADGPSLMLVRRSPLGKIGLPGRGFGAGAFEATSLLGALRLACLLNPELTPGIPGASSRMPASAVYVTGLGAEAAGGAVG